MRVNQIGMKLVNGKMWKTTLNRSLVFIKVLSTHINLKTASAVVIKVASRYGTVAILRDGIAYSAK